MQAYHTRNSDPLYRIAEIYVNNGFNNIPQDEVIFLNPNQQNVVRSFITQIKENALANIIVQGSPYNYGTREPIIGSRVGTDYQADIKEYERKFLSQQSNGGRKSRSRRKKSKGYKKGKSRKQKKTRNLRRSKKK
jgi:hypothetical protein